MPLFIRSRLRLSLLAIAAGLLATAALAASPTGAPSLAECIAAICSAAFRSAPAHEAPFLSENVGAMTRMLVGMEIKPSGDIDLPTIRPQSTWQLRYSGTGATPRSGGSPRKSS